MQEEHLDQPVVVQNYPGASGLKSLYHFLKQPADGHTLIAITNSFISQIVAAGKKDLLNGLHYLTMLAEDYECLIVNKGSGLDSLEDIREQSQSKQANRVRENTNIYAHLEDFLVDNELPFVTTLRDTLN